MADPQYEQQRNRDDAHAVWCVIINLPAFGELPALTRWYSNFPIELGGHDYEARLLGIPNCQSAAGDAADGGSFSLSNTDGKIYDLLYPYKKIIKEAQVTVIEALETITYGVSTGLYVGEIVQGGIGFISNLDLPKKDTVEITYVGDFSQKERRLGDRILTAKTCVKSFNVNGLLSPLVNACGWQIAQGGNPLYCSLLLEGPDGCLDHNNEHRFGAVRGFVDVTVTTVIGGSLGGFDYNTGGGQGGILVHPPLES